MLIFWLVVFVVSLILLVKGSDWLLDSSEKIGLSLGFSPFIVGITIVAVGTSFPELVSNLFAIFHDLTDVPVANVVGSNIANILLIVGLSAIVARRLTVSKDLIDLDLPLIAVTLVIFILFAYDGKIVFLESLFLIITYLIYISFAILSKDEDAEKELKNKPKISAIDILVLFLGILGLTVGAKYLIESISALSEILNIGVGLIAVTAVAVGTSLPELIVSVKAALRKQSEVALGNIFGSNIFNILAVVGIPGLFGTLTIDEKTFSIGLPVLIISSVLFIISGISRRIHVQEGAMFLLIYIIFMVKLFELF